MFIGTFPGMGSTVATTTPTGLEGTELKGWAVKQQIAPERQKGDGPTVSFVRLKKLGKIPSRF